MKHTIVGVDLSKNVIQVCVVKHGTVISNLKMSSIKFRNWLATIKPSMVIFEACATSNYWKQVGEQNGHDARLISAKLVAQIRQNQKTDKNDALAVVQASQLVDVQFINGKTFEHRKRKVKDGLFTKDLICQSTVFNDGVLDAGKADDGEAAFMAWTCQSCRFK